MGGRLEGKVALVTGAARGARNVTGINLRIDAGSLIKWPDGPKGWPPMAGRSP